MQSPHEVITSFYDAIKAKNSDAICSYYIQDENTYVVLEGPRLTTLGFTKIKKGWNDFCHSGLELVGIDWEEGPRGDIKSEMAWLGGIIKLSVKVKGKSFTQIFRASFIMINDTGEWRIRHEHVSGALTDPYGIGDWLISKKD